MCVGGACLIQGRTETPNGKGRGGKSARKARENTRSVIIFKKFQTTGAVVSNTNKLEKKP